MAKGAFAPALALALLLGGCATDAPASAERSFTAMDTGMTLTVHASDRATADDAADACVKRVRELDELLAPTGARSEIAQLNEADGKARALSPSTYALVEKALEAARLAHGAFDPTVCPLTDAWGFTSGDHRVPSPDEIARLLPLVGFDAVRTDPASSAATLEGGARIDVGGVAKGFAADELRALLRERGATSALLDLGGNVTALGAKPDGTAWKVGIADPAAPDQLVGSIELRDATASTSGAYQRFFDGEDGTRYHHLLDPATGYPADSDLASATVVGADGALCDALSTACYVLGLKGALDLWDVAGAGDAESGAAPFDLVLVGKDGGIRVTEGVVGSFVPVEGFDGQLSEVRRS